MKRKIFCSFYCVSNIFSADDQYITFNEANKVIFDVIDDNGFNIYGSPVNFKLLKEDIKNKKLPSIDSLTNFNKHELKNFGEDFLYLPSDTFDVDLGKLIKDEYIINYFSEYDKSGNSINVKLEDIDKIEITLCKKIYFNENSNLIFNGNKFNLKDICVGKDVFDLFYKDEDEKLETFMHILKYLKNQIEDIPEDLDEYKCYVESYKIENGDSCTMEEGEEFSAYIEDYINNVKDVKKTELVINSFANYAYDNDNYILLNEDLSKKYKIDGNEKYLEFEIKVNEFVKKFIDELNNKKDKKLLTDEELTNLIPKEFGNDIIIKSEEKSLVNKKEVKIIINDVNNYKDFINPKKIHLNFEAPDGYVFEDTFNSEVDVDFSEYDDINEETLLYDCVLKISHIDLNTIENEILYKNIDEDDSELQELKIDPNGDINYGLFYKIKLKKPINGITKEFDKNNLLINIKFNIDDNIKAKYELDGNFNNIKSPNNKIKIGKKISDLKTYINSNLGKNITNYELKENDTVVNDDDKVLTDNATYIFTFKEGSNCIKEKPKKEKTKEKEQNNTGSSEQNNTDKDKDNDNKCLCSGNNNKADKKGCCQ